MKKIERERACLLERRQLDLSTWGWGRQKDQEVQGHPPKRSESKTTLGYLSLNHKEEGRVTGETDKQLRTPAA